MPAAIAIPAIIGAAGAGASLVGAKMASNASRDAAKMQVAATDKAQAFNQQAYQDQQKALQPYMQAGQQSLGSLMSQYSGKPLQNAYAPPGQYGQPPQPQGQQGGGMSLMAAAQSGAVRPNGMGFTAGGGQPPQGGGLVRVKAPTGEMAQFPEGSPGLQQALQRGAVRL